MRVCGEHGGKLCQSHDPGVGPRAFGQARMGAAPWSPFEKQGQQPGVARGQDVVVQPVADIGDLPGGKAGQCDDLLEESGIGLGYPPTRR